MREKITSQTVARYHPHRQPAARGRVLRLAATVWCFPGTNLTWLERVPEILLESGHRGRQPYPLDEREQQLLFSELPLHAAEMATFVQNVSKTLIRGRYAIRDEFLD